MKCLAAIIVFTQSVLAADWQDLPNVPIQGSENAETVLSDYSSLHPWNASRPLPASFEDAGLTFPFRLVANELYLDGGSQLYLFKGSNGKFLMVCTEPASYYDSKNERAIVVTEPKIFIGAAHISSDLNREVPPKSRTERFLLEAIKTEVERINEMRADQAARTTPAIALLGAMDSIGKEK